MAPKTVKTVNLKLLCVKGGFPTQPDLLSVFDPSEGVLEFHKGVAAVQPDPSVCVRDGSLPPGLFLPGGRQETRGTDTHLDLAIYKSYSKFHAIVTFRYLKL